MLVTNEDYIYLMDKYIEVRYADRGYMFRKRNPIDPRTLPDVKDYFDNGQVQGFFVERNDKLFIFLLGSNQLIDWWYNFSFRFMRTPYKETGVRKEIKVHTGFYRSYLRIRDMIHKKVKDDKKVIVYGQSFGAAVATFASLDIKYNFPDKKVAYVTTGSPRVGNKEFVGSFNKRFPQATRFVYGKDIVTRVPPKLFGYAHVQGLVHFERTDASKNCFTDHLMEQYSTAIKQKYGS